MEEMKSSFIDIYDDIIEKMSEDDDDESNLDVLTTWVKFSGLKIKDGDCLIVRNGYRNEGKFLWDEQRKRVVNLDYTYDIDEYGCIPKSFDLSRFPAQFFSEIIDHNNFIRLKNDFIFQIVQHATFSQPPNELNIEDKIVWSYFMSRKTKYYVIGIASDAKYREHRVREEDMGAHYMEHEEMNELEVDSLEYAVNFMRMFVDRVKSERIEFLNSSSSEKTPENWLFVQC